MRNLEAFHQLRVRSIGITWSRPNAFRWGKPLRYPSSGDIGVGLTVTGKALVRVCDELGIIVDMAHLNERGFWDVAHLLHSPLVATHAAVNALAPHSRNLTNAQFDAIAATSGGICVILEAYVLRADGTLQGGATRADIVRHIEYIAHWSSVDHVGLGSDCEGADVPNDLKDVTGLPDLVDGLRKSGFDGVALRKKTHENWLRVIRETWE